MLTPIAIVACAAVAAALIYRYDLYDREPWYVVGAVMLAGAVVMAWLGGVEDDVIRWVGGGQPSTARIALVAAGLEEISRLAIVLAFAFLAPRYFNDPMDGLVYGSVVGLGMALEESMAVLAREAGAPVAPLLSGEIVRLFAHLIMGGITGFGIGMIRRHGGGRPWIPIAAGCLLVGTLIHFLWDYVALVSATQVGAERWAVPASVAVMVASIVVFGLLVVAGSRQSRAVFAPESAARVWRADDRR
jgi:RsiW-degrading membrane proteinase PrsW (M82 family)